MVVNGAGAAAIACIELIKAMGLPHENAILCDTKGVIYQGRDEGHEPVEVGPCRRDQGAHAGRGDEGRRRLLRPVGQGRGRRRRWSRAWGRSRSSSPWPIPIRRSRRRKCAAVRPDAIVATGRSDYPNQVNNVLGFPYIFRGALDVRASTINDAMKIAAADALAALAREDVPDEVAAAYGGRRLRYGPEYIIPVPFDPRLIVHRPVGGRQGRDGDRRRAQADRRYRRLSDELRARLDPTAVGLQLIFEQVRDQSQARRLRRGRGRPVDPRRDLPSAHAGYGTPVLVGREERHRARRSTRARPQPMPDGLEIHNARVATHNKRYIDFLYRRLQRQGFLYRDCQRMVNQDRNVFAACMVAQGDADAMVTRPDPQLRTPARGSTHGDRPAQRPARVRPLGRPVAQAAPCSSPTPRSTSCRPRRSWPISPMQTAAKARQLGHEPRVALLSFSNFGNPLRGRAEHVRDAVTMLDQRRIDFEYDGEMSADVALDYRADEASVYPFCRLIGPGQRADHAGAAHRQYLGQAAAAAGRRHGDRPDPDRHWTSRCRSSSPAPRCRTSSPPPPSPPSTRGDKSDPASRWTRRRWIHPAARAEIRAMDPMPSENLAENNPRSPSSGDGEAYGIPIDGVQHQGGRKMRPRGISIADLA